MRRTTQTVELVAVILVEFVAALVELVAGSTEMSRSQKR